jgi:hypothetical protein
MTSGGLLRQPARSQFGPSPVEMTATSQTPPARRQPRSLKTTLILLAIVIGYALLQPKLEHWLDTELPPFEEEARVDQTDELPAPSAAAPATSRPDSGGADASSDDNRTNRGSAADVAAMPVPPTDTANTPGATATEHETPRLGELRDIGGNVFQSTAGLYYRPGSQEGHRIKHILRHHEDDPDRPVHGVFNGDRNEVFAVIDEAYLYTFDHGPPRVTTEKDDGRTIYRIDLGRRIGYVGGQSGKRQGHAAARHVQLILDGAEVVTAYPVRVGR